MMMMEAIRLSLLSEEERKRKEEKEAKKEAKKKGKEGKHPGKTPSTPIHISTDSDDAPRPSESSTSASPSYSDDTAPNSKGKGKGKGVEHQVVTSPNAEVPASQATGLTTNLRPRSISRQVSNSSSTATSFMDSAPGSVGNGFHGSTSSFEASAGGSALKVAGSKSEDITRASTPPMGGGSGAESMFNFRSLAAMIGDDDDRLEESRHVEHV